MFQYTVSFFAPVLLQGETGEKLWCLVEFKQGQCFLILIKPQTFSCVCV
jgi:hypothetical protein